MTKLLVTIREVQEVYYSIEIENTEESILKGVDSIIHDLDTAHSFTPLNSKLIANSVLNYRVISDDEYHKLRREAGIFQ